MNKRLWPMTPTVLANQCEGASSNTKDECVEPYPSFLRAYDLGLSNAEECLALNAGLLSISTSDPQSNPRFVQFVYAAAMCHAMFD
ncbi:hypothetical protein HJFPF1_11094 [Paramyrothecium foliicola]|nr:hypothetical protein HJFPF1_11094 [Paramyrothecium foliicola]